MIRNCTGCGLDTEHDDRGPSVIAGWRTLVCTECGSLDDYPPRAAETLTVIEHAGVKITRTGLDLSGVRRLSFADYETIGYILGQTADAMRWALGDWLIFGDAVYGEKYAQAVEATGRTKQTLMNYRWIAQSIPRSRRRPSLTWSHHRLVARLDPADADRWLDRADAEALNAEELSGLLKPPPPIETGPAGGAESGAAAGKPGQGLARAPRLGPGEDDDGEILDPDKVVTLGTAVAGIDFDTYKATIAILPFDAAVADVIEVRFRKPGQRTAQDAYEAVKRVPRAIWEADLSGVGVAWIERGFGENRNADYSLGRVQGAITAVLAQSFPVHEMHLTDWRKKLFGKGAGKRAELVALQRERLRDRGIQIRRGKASEPVSPTYSMLTKDDLDAVSIALVGRDLNEEALAA